MRSRVHMLAAAGFCLLVTPHGGSGQSRSTTEVGGYVKYLFDYADPATGGGFSDHLLHARLNTAWYPSDVLSGKLELRFRAFEGGTVERTPGFVAGLRNRSLGGNLDLVLWDAPSSAALAEIDRLFVAWTPPGVSVSVGRQRIAWGTNLVWNPIDIFNPLSVLDFDYEERPPIDGVRVQWYTGELSKLEAAAKAGRTSDEAIVAWMWSTNLSTYDVRLLGGLRGKRWLAGGAWAGDILGGGFRGELLVREGGSVSGALSGDYTFPSSLYLHTELLYNNHGVWSGAATFRATALQEGLLSPARFSLYQEISADVTPLIRASVFVICNPDDWSSVLVPSMSWNVAQNLDLLALFIIAQGREGTEYGEYGRFVFLRLRYSF